MNARAYFTLLRPARLLYALALVSTLLLMIHVVARVPFGAQKPVTTAFAWWAVMLPLGMGWILSEIIHELLHRPFGIWLPNAPRRLAIWHAGALGCGCLFFTVMAWIWDRTLPVFSVSGIAAAGLTLFFPLSRATKEGRDKAVLALIVIASLSVIILPDKLHAAVLVHPWLSGLLGWGIALVCFSGGFACSPHRARVWTPYTPSFRISFSNFSNRNLGGGNRPQVKNPDVWTVSPTDGRLRSWLQVAVYEQGGKKRGHILRNLLYLIGVILLIVLLLSAIFPQSFGKGVYEIVWPYRRKGEAPIFFIVMFMSLGKTILTLRPDFLYPISRARRALVSYLDSLLSLVQVLAAMIGMFVLAAWLVALGQSWPTPLIPAVRFILLFAWMVPCMPLAQWGAMHLLMRKDLAVALVCSGFGLILALITTAVLRHSTTFLLSPAGITLCLLLIATSQYAFYAALRRFYRKGDLLQHGRKRQNLSLI